MSIIINPGSGPVQGATETSATENIGVLVEDLIERGCEVGTIQLRGDEGDGRWSFNITVNGKVREVEMPGLPIDRVRYVSDEQNIWDFPRLYVDGSSWVWMFAVNVLAAADDEDDDE